VADSGDAGCPFLRFTPAILAGRQHVEFRDVTCLGVVREWNDEEGWGVVDSDETPGGCWTHYSSVLVARYHTLNAGQHVELDWERADQDGYSYRAVRAWPQGQDPVPLPSPSNH
jgi:CspA family cold shock protein